MTSEDEDDSSLSSSESELQLPQYVEHEVVHYQQRFNWDCGVSCVLMLLPALHRQHLLDNFDEVCREEGFGQSTWTIDLCYLLKRYGVRHSMYTTTLDVNEDYKRHKYYDKIIDMDRERVKRRFAESASGASGVRVSRRAVSARRLLRHVRTCGPALVLLDAGLLACDLCKHNKLRAEFRRCFGGGYRGHYVLLVGYSARGAGGAGAGAGGGGGGAGKLLYRDPALSARLCACPPRRLHQARAASGTDRDVILLHPAPAPAPPHPHPHTTSPRSSRSHTTSPDHH